VTYPVVARGAPGYPPLLAELHDPPARLYLRGGPADVLSLPAVAVVGARSCSAYGSQVARELAGDLAAAGVVVVSGLARGVDGEAHRGALHAGGITVAVLGCGIDRDYPRAHAELARRIVETGLVVSEYEPGVEPSPWRFPARNRIIAGLTRATVVVEARARSGALITADFALEQGRAVLAVPGNVLGGRNYGAHALLRDGAKLVECADDILEELPLGIRDWGLGTGESKESKTTNPASQDPVLRRMTEGETYDLDELSELSGVDRVKLLPRLLELELGGAVRRVGGGRFVRFRGPC